MPTEEGRLLATLASDSREPPKRPPYISGVCCGGGGGLNDSVGGRRGFRASHLYEFVGFQVLGIFILCIGNGSSAPYPNLLRISFLFSPDG